MEIQILSLDSIYKIDSHPSSAHTNNPRTESDVSYVEKTFVLGTRNSFGLTIDLNNGAV